MPNNWKIYKLGDIAKLRKKNITPKDFDNQHYIGLEHIGQGTFLLDGIGLQVMQQAINLYLKAEIFYMER